MARRKKYRKRATKVKNKQLNWLFRTNRRISDYTNIRSAVKYLLKDEKNFKNLIKAIDAQNPGFFTDVQYNENLVDIKTKKEKAIDFVTGRLEAARKIEQQRSKGKRNPSISELIEHEFKTEAYMSREQRISSNLDKIFSKRISTGSKEKGARSQYLFLQERNLFKEKFGTTNLGKVDLQYINELPYDMPRSSGSQGYGYTALANDGTQVVFEMVREQAGSTEYVTNLVIHYVKNGKWASMHSALAQGVN